MDSFIESIKRYLVKNFNIRNNEVDSIIEDEWEYLDEAYYNSLCIEEVAENLITFYNVA